MRKQSKLIYDDANAANAAAAANCCCGCCGSCVWLEIPFHIAVLFSTSCMWQPVQP